MIPAKIVRFLEERANIGFAGTRDHNLVPLGHRVSAWHVDAAGRTLTAFLRPTVEDRFLESLSDNGAIALTFEEVGTHETYQIKGHYLGHRLVQPADVDIVGRLRERLAKGVSTLYHDEHMIPFVKAFVVTPTVAVTVEVREVFVQTPGPGAGERIAPSPDVS